MGYIGGIVIGLVIITVVVEVIIIIMILMIIIIIIMIIIIVIIIIMIIIISTSKHVHGLTLSIPSIMAPLSMSILTTSNLPLLAATCRGVDPY